MHHVCILRHLLGKRLWLDVLNVPCLQHAHAVMHPATAECIPKNISKSAFALKFSSVIKQVLSARRTFWLWFWCVCILLFFPCSFWSCFGCGYGETQSNMYPLFVHMYYTHIESVQHVLRPHEYASSQSRRTATNVWSDVYFVFIYVYSRCWLLWRCILLRIFNFLFYGFCFLAVIVCYF